MNLAEREHARRRHDDLAAAWARADRRAARRLLALKLVIAFCTGFVLAAVCAALH